MPDFERLTRSLHIHLAGLRGESDKREVEAYYRGQDAARKEIAWVVLAVALLGVIIAWVCR